MRKSIGFLTATIALFSLISGCSQEPSVEKEMITPAPKSAAHPPASSNEGMVGSSHQQEAALEQAKELAENAAKDAIAENANAPSEPLKVPEGFRATHVAAQGGMPSLDLAIPNEWEQRTPGSSMRLLELALPGDGNPDTEGALTIFYFGPSAGTIQMNIDRWIGQFTQPDGSSSKDKAKVVEEKGDNYKYTLVDLSGTMAASSMMGAPATPEHPDWRMLASIVSTPHGPWFIKATGPEATMAKWHDAFVKMNQSAR